VSGTAERRWDVGVLPVVDDAAGSRRLLFGSIWRSWFVHHGRGRRYAVLHIPSGTSLTEFDRLRRARRFCEAIDELADWSTSEPRIDAGLDLLLHRAALRVADGEISRPILHLIGGGHQ
jgi:hypothetical protein